MKEKYITIKEAIKLLNVSRSTLWHWDKTNYLKAYHIGKSVVYKTADIDSLATKAKPKTLNAYKRHKI
ncbi:helix-turn-helix transcriptional regulator [Campylobacter lanienae]|uniref:helix-turn-helix transcriptional regulator n=2 Tax=Campylobacter lanienae TaxID=75658 RepID=UPI000BB3E893|nr:helix-turn-helix domain-containing protein [Campylobacter lanienae]